MAPLQENKPDILNRLKLFALGEATEIRESLPILRIWLQNACAGERFPTNVDQIVSECTAPASAPMRVVGRP